MTWLQQLSEWLATFKCWYVIQPWESAIRVRVGKRIMDIGPGFHLRLPFLDQVYIQNTRLRVLNLPVQTVTNKAGDTLTMSAIVCWRIENVRLIYEQLHHPEDWLYNTVLAACAQAAIESDVLSADAIAPRAAEIANHKMVVSNGLVIVSVAITDFAKVMTLRLITGEGNTGWSWNRVGSLDEAHVA